MSTTIVWFRRDLRLTHNPALAAAAERGSVVPVYIHAPDEEAPWQPGAASRWWNHHSLSALQRSLKAQGVNLTIRSGNSLEQLQQIIQETGATSVVWNRLYEPAIIERDRHIKTQLSDSGIHCQSFNANLLFEPWQIENKSGQPFRVFTPYWKTCLARLQASETRIQAAPKLVALEGKTLNSQNVDELKLLPSLNWDASFYDHWQPGEAGAMAALQSFKQDCLDSYKRDRDFPGLDCSSKLSPHLHFGEISPWQIWAAISQLPPAQHENEENSRRHFMSEIGWREFAHHLLYHFPFTSNEPLNAKYKAMPWWRSDVPNAIELPHQAHAAEHLKRWQQGNTGVSLVDAGMQQLWQSGWMHNRVRMVVASLLTKNMGIHWLEGAHWFWDTLVDADLACNSLGWQWAAGCGADAAPYFRIFNPDTQAARFDEPGSYRSQWLGAGWQQRQSCIDLKSSRRHALEAYEHIRQLDVPPPQPRGNTNAPLA
jgi:deoxyribodipyrimidine photo-lyase